MSRDSQLRAKEIASTMVIDARTGDLIIDGVTLPWWIASEPTIEPADHPSMPNLVTIEMHVDNVLILRTLDEDLKAIRELGAKHRAEAVEEFRVKMAHARVADIAARLADKDARRPAQQTRMRQVGDFLGGGW